MKEESMMLILQGIMDELPPFEKYWTNMFQNKSMPVVGKCQTKILTFTRLCNDILSPEDDTNKYTPSIIGDMAVTETKSIFLPRSVIKKSNGRVSVKC